MATLTKYQGTSGADSLSLSTTKLKTSAINLGAGFDTVKLSTIGDYTFNASAFGSMQGVDALDFSRASAGRLEVWLSDAMLAQSDARALTIVSGGDGIELLSASSALTGTVFVAGSGDVHLNDLIGNTVSIANGASVHVFGGAGSDIITAGATGTLLDGGRGGDVLKAGAGADTVIFHQSYGSDRVTSFDAAQDKIDLSGNGLTFLSEVQARLTDTAQGAVLDLGGGDRLLLEGVSSASLSIANFKGIVTDPAVYRVDATMTADAVNALISTVTAGSTILFTDGTHQFDKSLIVNRGDITLKGESETGTILKFAFSAGTEDSSIKVTAGEKSALGFADGALVHG